MTIEDRKTPLDEIAEFNRGRWDALARAGVKYSVPVLDLDESTARLMIDKEGILPTARGQRVLCLAAGGGQQSVAFALLGDEVTVLDISDVQLERDDSTAQRYGHKIRLERGDMRDLSRFDQGAFDIVWQAHSINFVPDARAVFTEVSRVLINNGVYRLEITNPFIHGTWERSWTGSGYLLAGPYQDGEVPSEEPWRIRDAYGNEQYIRGPREFRHTLGTVINGLIAEGLQISGLWEDCESDEDAIPGSWRHFKRFGSPWITIVSQKKAV